jgi:hypothetical protein
MVFSELAKIDFHKDSEDKIQIIIVKVFVMLHDSLNKHYIVLYYNSTTLSMQTSIFKRLGTMHL